MGKDGPRNDISIGEIRRLQLHARSRYLYQKERDIDLHHIEAFLIQTTLLEGVLTNLGLMVLGKEKALNALYGKRRKRYGYDNAINDLYMLNVIDTDEFKMLEGYKNKRNDFIHNILSDNIATAARKARSMYKSYEEFVDDLIGRVAKMLPREKR